MRYVKAGIVVLCLTFLTPFALSTASAQTPLPTIDTYTSGSPSDSADGFTVGLDMNGNPGVVAEAGYAAQMSQSGTIRLLPIAMDEDQLNSANLQLVISSPSWYQDAWNVITGQGLPYLTSCDFNVTDTDLNTSVFQDSITATPIETQTISIPNYQLQYAGNYEGVLNCTLSNNDTIGDVIYIYVPSSSATVNPEQIGSYITGTTGNSEGGDTIFTTILNDPGFATNGSYNPVAISSQALGSDGFNIIIEYGLAKNLEDFSDLFSSIQSCTYQFTDLDTGNQVSLPNITLSSSGATTFSISGNQVAIWNVPIDASFLPGNYSFYASCNMSSGDVISDSIRVYIPDSSTGGTTSCSSNCGSTTTSTTPVVPEAFLDANPTAITQGQSVGIGWSSSNANSCSGTNFSTNNATSGSIQVSPSGNTTYSLVCSGAGGTSNTAAATIQVYPPSQTTSQNVCQAQAVIRVQ